MRSEFSQVELAISEPSADDGAFIVRGLQFRAYERGAVQQPSMFICECDTEEMAKAIAALVTKQLVTEDPAMYDKFGVRLTVKHVEGE